MFMFCKSAVTLFLFITSTIAFADDENAIRIKKHQQMVYPVVRVSCADSGGSGTVIYSNNPSDPDCFETFILTNYHVVESAIEIGTEWSSLLGREIRVEKRKTVKVEIFRYENISIVTGRESFDADIKAHSKSEDLAILQLRSKKKAEYIAFLQPKENINSVYLFDSTVVVGCSLSKTPLITTGVITSMNEELDNKLFWMSSAAIVYGNSGGAIYIKNNDNWCFVGVPSRVSVVNGSPVTHMGHFIPMSRIYQWAKNEHLDFIYDPSKTPNECFKLRSELAEKTESEPQKNETKPPYALPQITPPGK